MNNNDYLNKIHSKYIFIEKDISKFKEMFFIDGEDIEEKIYKYIANKITNEGLIDLFEKIIEIKNIDTAFCLCNEVIDKYNIDIREDDIEILYNNTKYQDFYNNLIKRNKIKDINDIKIKNELLKKVLEAKVLLSTDIEIEEIKEEDYENLTDNILRDYLISIKNFTVLTKEEEQELYKKYLSGDENAKEELINHNLKLVVSMARKMHHTSLKMDMMDLIQEGNIGLMTALKKFDLSKGYKFSTYAYWWIRQALVRCIDNKDSTIRIPVHMQEKIKKYYRIKKDFINKNYREPTDEELMKLLKLTEENYKKLREVLNILNMDSIDRNINDNGKKDRESKLGDFLIDEKEETLEEKVEREIFHEEAEKILNKLLSEKEIYIIKHRNGFDTDKETLEKIGNRLGITRERVRQIERKATKKLEAYGNEIKKDEMIREIINGKGNEEMNKKSIYELISGEINEVNEIITELSEEEKKLIIKRNNEKLNKEDNQKFFLIVSKIRNRLKQKREETNPTKKLKSIYESINAPKKEIDEILKELSEEERELIIKRNNEKISKEEKQKYYQIITKVRRKLEHDKKIKQVIEKPIKQKENKKEEKPQIVEEKEDNRENILLNNYRQLLNIALKDPRIIQEIDIMDISITCVRYGIGKSNKSRNIESISKFYNISKEEVENISTTVLEKLYNIIVGDIKDNNEKYFIKKNDEKNQ